MVADKKVFFGALFDFHTSACDELINQFKESIAADDDTFVSYDKANKAFNFMVNRHDDKLVSLFAGHLKTYVDEQAESGPDPYQSPKIRPFDSTVIQLPLLDEVKLEDGHEGLLAISNDSSDEAEVYAIPGHISALWKPEHGKISIVTPELAASLAQLTGCSFYPDHAANQVGISGVNFNEALYKLQNLERLQTLLASQRSEESSKAIANVLMLRKPEKNIAIEFLPLIRDTRPYKRIIVSDPSRIRLDNKCVGELRYTHNRTDHHIPSNLMNPSGTAENRPFSVWTGFSSLPLGRRINMEPRRPYKSSSKISPAANVYNTSTVTTPASLLPPTETRKIESWAENIKEVVNPNEIPVELPKELTQGEMKIGRQRRLVSVDSDSEDEPVATAAAISTAAADRGGQTVAQARLGSDNFTDEGQEPPPTLRRPMPDDSTGDEGRGETAAANTQIKAGRRRRLQTADSDDSSDGEPALPIPKSPLKADETISNAFQEVSKEITGASRRGRGTGMQSNFSGRGMGRRFSTRGSPTHSQSQSERGRGARRTSKQEPGSPGQHHDQTQPRPVGRGYSHSTSPRAEQQSGRGKSVPHGRFRGGNSNRGLGKGGAIQHPDFGDGNLVDIVPTAIASPVIPPPGLDIGVESREEVFLPSANLLDEPLINIQRASIPPASSSRVTTPVSASAVVDRFHTSSSSGPLYVNTFNPRPNVSAMEEEQLQMLLAHRARLARNSGGVSESHVGLEINTTPSTSGYSTAQISSERLQAEEEIPTRRFYHTMGQGAPNPNKKGKSQNTESKKERQARIAKAKAEAHGEPPITRKPERSSLKIGSSSDEVDKDMSARKRRALRSGLPAGTDPAFAEEELKMLQATKIIESLMPVFEAGRAFSGKLTFEIQFGQVVSPFSNGGGHNNFIDLQEWHRRFHPELGMLPEVASFTNILTTNGADADRILEMKCPSPGTSPLTVWSKNEPIPRDVSYEFECQSQDSEQFWLVVNQNGAHQIRRPSTVVGMVNLHFPGQIWDACAVVAGVMNHRFAEPVEDAVNTFVSSLYIPGDQKKISITYHLPDTNMTVRNLVMKRKSVHSCNLPGKHDFQLEITEVQTLYHQFHKDDKKLAQGFVKDYARMINDGRLHYEVSLVHKQINELLEQNAVLELGELTRAWTESKILSKEDTRSIVDLTTLVVSKIDGIGSENIGTLFRRDVERMVERQLTLNPVPISVAAMSRLNPGATSHIPGVRGGRADIVWENGQPYAYGYGGALVPIPDQRGSGSDEVVPDDSASQAGPAGAPMPIRGVHPTQAANISTTVQPRAGNGFW